MRVAIRGEGTLVNAYLAPPKTMVGAVLIASINKQLCVDHPVLLDDFKALMVRTAAMVCESTFGVAPSRIDSQAAPEHEKAGHA